MKLFLASLTKRSLWRKRKIGIERLSMMMILRGTRLSERLKEVKADK